MRVEFIGLQYDKLTDFWWNQIKSASLQELSYTIYEVQSITSANATTYPLCVNANQSKNNFSLSFPLSDIDTFQVEAIEILFNINSDLQTIFDDKKTNYLTVILNSVEIMKTDLSSMVSLT